MKISYLAFVRFPNEKAHGVQIAKQCEALADEGLAVTLFIPGRRSLVEDNPYEYYGIKKNFSIKVKKVFVSIRLGRSVYLLSQLIFSMRTLLSTKSSVILSQDEWVLLLHVLLGRNCVYEVHNGRSSFVSKFVSKKSSLIIANSKGTKDYYSNLGVSDKKILVCPNGVDLDKFCIDLSQVEARNKVNLPSKKKIVLYTGHLYDWKGVDTLATSSMYLAEDVLTVFVGGTESDLEIFRKQYSNNKNILILGHRPNNEMPFYLRSADVLVIPNSRIGESERFTSPMKLFEYLSAKKPIVASNLPSIREIINEDNAFFFIPGDPYSLSEEIKIVLSNPEESVRRASNARKEADKYTWNRKIVSDYLLGINT